MSNKQFTEIILSELNNVLFPLGYKKKGYIFKRENTELIYLIGLQKSTGSTKSEVKITLNLGITSKFLIESESKKKQVPNIWEAHWRNRLGHLLPEKTDKWWFISSESEAVKSCQEICSFLNNYGLLEFDKIQNLADLSSLWKLGVCHGLTDYQRKTYLDKLGEA